MKKPLLVTEFLDRARRYYGDEEAVVATTGERFTYDELGERADGFSAALQSRGVEKGDRVAVLDPNTHYHLEAAYGSMQLGAVHMPLNYRLVPADFEYVLNDAGVTAVYADYAFAEKIDAVRDEIPAEIFVTNDPEKAAESTDGEWLDFDELVAESTDYERPEMDEDDIITINYTSGTTGDPKGVCRTHRAETIHAYLISMHQDIADDDVYLWTLPMFHVNGWGHIYAITGHGAKHVCTRGVEAEVVLDAIRDEDVSYLCAAPTVLNILMKHYREEGGVETTGASPVRAATAGAAPPEATIRTVEDEFGWRLMHVYGATETGPLITTSEAGRYLTDGDDRFGVKKKQGIGYLGTDVRVVDEDGNDVPRDEQSVGEIVVAGNQVMEKYWNKPEETEEAFSARLEGYYHMGDLAVVDENGFISIQDRKKDIIISGGENISSIELEDTLFDHDEVADVAVIPVPSDEWGESPKAFVVPTSGDPDAPGVTAEALIAFCRERIATYKVPKEVEFVTELPKTATGKIQKYELREREWEDEGRMVGEG
ncbi:MULTISPECIES: long-chain-fatty-acid--CoA ligase [Haloferax]|uniref:long-chain-fatty-acid--CoA ligase n=1 Tax=Haloferax TaxID=2251 RepID=UPI00165EFF81|nr:MULTISPECIES: long-chain-fatty-acid--CoA ligase [Haloferax]MBC9985678.1 long-chain-fatty-acid--CoA ligase [Haloferax sp. AS1]WEL25169.1 Acyl-CoA synthetase (AMP-forming)/AMP-acid ligase II [Haloferax lucentense]WEL28991.1 Acyl-CoA synthetase (AMP-forming)/AMP-acid ligase II [Haloferax alexandrinus]